MSSAQNLSISRDGVWLFCTVGKMAADEYNDSDQFSDDDVYDNPVSYTHLTLPTIPRV